MFYGNFSTGDSFDSFGRGHGRSRLRATLFEAFVDRSERFMRHRHGGRGFGPFGGDLLGGRGIPGGRRFGSADLQIVLLALLAERPAHGYELIRTLEERSAGFYAPSPGMIYPALTYLEEIGHAVVTQDGNRKLYTLTDAGRDHLAANRERVTAMLDMLQRIGARMGDVRDAFAGVGDADARGVDEVSRARHHLKHALSRKRGSAPDELRRIARILESAATQILDGETNDIRREPTS